MEYERINFHELRKYARKIGVKAPTTLNKATLIEEIKKVERGEVKPVFKKGKKAKQINSEEVEEILKKEWGDKEKKIILFLIDRLRRFLLELEEEINK